MRAISFLALSIALFSPIRLEQDILGISVRTPEFIVWNVGQGLWTTWVDQTTCLHFDAGGERAPLKKIRALCADRKNIFNFSHWDLDHISFAGRMTSLLPESCVLNPPQGTGSARKQHLFDALPLCLIKEISPQLNKHFEEIDLPPARSMGRRVSALKPNDLSRVFVVDREILAPGDSESRDEKRWRESLSRREQHIHLLVLGHHGSRTSTSDFLLHDLPMVRQAIASARKSRYGHPHKEVIARLKTARIALLSTEDWGTIIWQEAEHSTDGKDDTPGSSCVRRAHK